MCVCSMSVCVCDGVHSEYKGQWVYLIFEGEELHWEVRGQIGCSRGWIFDHLHLIYCFRCLHVSNLNPL